MNQRQGRQVCASNALMCGPWLIHSGHDSSHLRAYMQFSNFHVIFCSIFESALETYTHTQSSIDWWWTALRVLRSSVCLDSLGDWLMIAFIIIWNSNLVPLLEGLSTSNPCRIEFSFFWVFAGIEQHRMTSWDCRNALFGGICYMTVHLRPWKFLQVVQRPEF